MTALRAALVLAGAALATHCGPPPAPREPAPLVDDNARAGLVYLNQVRQATGLLPVTLDPYMSRDAALHAQYLALNAGKPEVEGLAAHHEVPGLPGYTPGGAAAGVDSVIDWRDDRAPEAIDAWLSTLYHRIPLLRRDLLRIGIGRVGTIHVLMVDRERSPAVQPPVMFPMPGQRDVPSLFSQGEVPEPRPAAWFGALWADAVSMRSGYPVTVTFDARAAISDVHAMLADESGPVEVAVSSPQAPATGFPQGPVVAMLPRTPLRASTTYRAIVDFVERGAQRRLAWEFRTADPVVVDASRLTPPRDGYPIVLEGVVDLATRSTLCESAEPTRCRARIDVELLHDQRAGVFPKITILDGDTDTDRVLGLTGRRVRASGFAAYVGAPHLSIQIANAAALEVSPDEPPEIAADRVGDAQVDTVARVTGEVMVLPAAVDRTNYVPIGPGAAVYVQASAATWAAVFAKLGGSTKKLVTKRVRVRGAIRRGAPMPSDRYIAVRHPAQIELVP